MQFPTIALSVRETPIELAQQVVAATENPHATLGNRKLDLTDVFAKRGCDRSEAFDFIEGFMKSADHIELRLSGGYIDAAGWFVPNVSHDIPAPVFDLLEFALGLAFGKVEAIVIELDPQ